MNLLEKGYGITSKIVMKDKSLSLKAKGIYIFLCSYSDEKGICFPKRDTIMKYLCIGAKSTYYKYLNELIEKNYIDVSQEKIEGKFTPNVYKIKRVLNGVELFRNSFGIVPRAVMEDKGIDISSKVIYTYLSCYSNKEKVSFMNIDQMTNELKISYRIVNNSIKTLIDAKLIDKQQNIIDNKFSSNSYILLHYPNTLTVKIEEANSTAIDNITERDEKRRESAKKDSAKEKLEKDIVFYESLVKENIKYDIVCTNAQERITENYGEIERNTEKYREIERNTEKYGELQEKQEFYSNVVALVLDTIFSENDSYKIQGSNKPKELVKSVLLKLTHEQVEFAFEKIKGVSEQGYIKNPKAYMLNVLYNSSQDTFLDKAQRNGTR